MPNDLTPSSPTPYNRSFVEAAYKTIPAVVHIKVTNDVATDGNWVTPTRPQGFNTQLIQIPSIKPLGSI